MVRRPVYLDSERIDDLARMCLSLASEIWTLRDRVTVLEHLLEQRGGLSRAELDAFVPHEALAEELASMRAAFVERVVGAPFTAADEAPPLAATAAR